MNPTITVGVYRVQDPRYESLPKKSKELVALHDLRKVALHEILDKETSIQVTKWGDTDDTTSHEYIELVMSLIGSLVLQPLVIAGIKILGEKLTEKAIDEGTSSFVKWVVSQFVKKAKDKKISDFSVKLKDGTLIQVSPPSENSQISISFKDGTLESIKYDIA